MTVGFALCGSFCTFASVFPIMEKLTEKHEVIPIFSFNAATIDSRFGLAKEHLARAEAICGRKPIVTIAEAEPIGPKKLLDALAVMPCTGNTLAKLAAGEAFAQGIFTPFGITIDDDADGVRIGGFGSTTNR